MTAAEPRTTLDPAFSSPGATPVPWAMAREALGGAGIYWLTTIRLEGRPHVTPLIGVWLDGALHFCTGAQERKAKNLADKPQCVLTTGCNSADEGLDVVVEGAARRVTDEALLTRLAADYEAKYGAIWHFDVRDGAFVGDEGNVAQVYAVAPVTAFGFQRGEISSQTRWRF